MIVTTNELRRGNWLMGRIPVLVESIRDNNNVGIGKGDPYLVTGNNPCLYPIPLTPEILEKCGFKKDSEYETLAYKDTAICCHWDGVEYCFQYGLDSDLTIAACEYVHQLQNLIYALTGEELTINL